MTMKDISAELRTITNEFTIRIQAIPDEVFVIKHTPGKWSKQEILGHLADSAQNNLRRFLCGQYEAAPPRILYDQDFWVAANQYQTMDRHDLLQFWRLLNLRICAVLDTMPAENYRKQCDSGTLRTLQWLASDYVKHMKHHLNQIVSGSFNVIYENPA